MNLTNNGDRETVLHCAAQYGHLECVKQLLDSGTEPNIKNIRKETALDQYGRQVTQQLIVMYLFSVVTFSLRTLCTCCWRLPPR